MSLLFQKWGRRFECSKLTTGSRGNAPVQFLTEERKEGENKKSAHGSLFPRGAKRPAETIKRKEHVDFTVPRGPIPQKKQHP